MLSANTIKFEIMFFAISLLLQTGNLLVVKVDKILSVQDLDCLAEILSEACVFLFVLFNAFAQIFKIPVEQRTNEVVINIFERLGRPTRRLEVSLVQHIQMMFHFNIRLVLGLFLALAQIVEHLVVHLLRVLHIRLITHGRVQVHHVFTDKRLHLQRIKVLLVVDHVTKCLFVLLNLCKLDEEHII